ncbi:MAG: hypothetical protein KVP17_004811 [Porospora cf. gigantea B]|uniref:uncharacterized protein n=1 Tax=Porospora cf. gigantea B TaxID=2853592 RepID=UPI00357188FB|nr:MAG: hypothetical protein KVP17_004811 [Porospora cf. gigantea B]
MFKKRRSRPVRKPTEVEEEPDIAVSFEDRKALAFLKRKPRGVAIAELTQAEDARKQSSDEEHPVKGGVSFGGEVVAERGLEEFLLRHLEPEKAQESDAPVALHEETHLFEVPADLQIPDTEVEREVHSIDWYSGLADVPLTVQDKLKAVEETEKVKRRMLGMEKKHVVWKHEPYNVDYWESSQRGGRDEFWSELEKAREERDYDQFIQDERGDDGDIVPQGFFRRKKRRKPDRMYNFETALPGADSLRDAFGARFSSHG